MPPVWVKDEDAWDKAKKQVQNTPKYKGMKESELWPIITDVYEKMTGYKPKKEASRFSKEVWANQNGPNSLLITSQFADDDDQEENFRQELKDHYGDKLSDKILEKVLDHHDCSVEEYRQDHPDDNSIDTVMDWLGY